MNPLVALTVAGSDSGGAAGIAADLGTFAGLGVHGACVLTVVTAQDTTGVREIHPVPVATIEAQLDAVLDDLPVAAVKTGMLGSPDVVRLVAERLAGRVLVVDPVLVATSGAVLGDDEVVEAYRHDLLPVATVITPNLDEARALLGHDAPPDVLACGLAALGPAVVLTGGVVSTSSTTGKGSTTGGEGSTTGGEGSTTGEGSTSGDGVITDWVALPGHAPVPLTHPSVVTDNDHGTGCTFSAALAVELARRRPMAEAARRAAAYTAGQLRLSSSWTLGGGRGPIAHITLSHEAPIQEVHP